jgi:hypothetical protein
MREKFVVHNLRSPFSWACRLCAWAKKVRDPTTSLGYIFWNDEGTAVSYNQISYLTMISLGEFNYVPVHRTQIQLEELLLVHPQ